MITPWQIFLGFLSLSHQKNLYLIEFLGEFLELPRKFSVVERWRKRNDYSMANISLTLLVPTLENSPSG
ncbi:hypothetical protein [Dapis sp. BLCC M229]|uniref:hypothetical protein n=1 Tax=Dapis sp. BLCC M229 TaxID=3400188 RepID=UPI003CE8321C